MQGIEATFDDVSLERGQLFRKVPLEIVLVAVALAALGRVGVLVLEGRLEARREAAVPAAIPDIVVTPQAIPPAPAMATADANPYGAIIVEPEWAVNPPLPAAPLVAKLEGVPPASPTDSVPPPAAAETAPSAPSVLPAETVPAPPTSDVPNIADSAPLPPPRPPEFGPAAKPAERRAIQESVVSAPAPVDNRNVFQKLFGLGQPSAPTTSGAKAPETRVAAATPETRVASAAPEARAATAAPKFRFPGFSFFGGSGPVAGYDQWTAVYDISARTVYLPDGTKLEAHSGYGDKLDDPRYVNEPMRGATPPHLYELEPREASFHGVQALRLKPIGEGGIFGRAGLLAHSYMLGPNGESNGCVSFKNYEAFLRAYENGEIKRLAVVTRL